MTKTATPVPFQVIVTRVKAGTVTLASECAAMVAFVAGLDDAAALRECKAQAAAVMEYLKHRKDASVAEHNAAVKIKARVEHRLGEVLATTVKHKGRPSKKSDTVSDLNGRVPEGIPLRQSSRTQALARVPWQQIEKRIDDKTAGNVKASQARVVKELLQERQRADNKKLVERATPFTAVPSVFQTILIDPPWAWEDEGDGSQMGRGRPEYAALSFDELLGLPVGEKAATNCHLYLWITNRSLPKGFALLEAWGFRYVVSLTWCKPSPGLGNYFRGSTEHVLFGVKGSLPLLRNDVGTWFAAARGKKHSAKPAAFFELVESCSPGPWLEVFSRGGRPGWMTWGAEAAKSPYSRRVHKD